MPPAGPPLQERSHSHTDQAGKAKSGQRTGTAAIVDGWADSRRRASRGCRALSIRGGGGSSEDAGIARANGAVEGRCGVCSHVDARSSYLRDGDILRHGHGRGQRGILGDSQERQKRGRDNGLELHCVSVY